MPTCPLMKPLSLIGFDARIHFETKRCAKAKDEQIKYAEKKLGQNLYRYESITDSQMVWDRFYYLPLFLQCLSSLSPFFLYINRISQFSPDFVHAYAFLSSERLKILFFFLSHPCLHSFPASIVSSDIGWFRHVLAFGKKKKMCFFGYVRLNHSFYHFPFTCQISAWQKYWNHLAEKRRLVDRNVIWYETTFPRDLLIWLVEFFFPCWCIHILSWQMNAMNLCDLNDYIGFAQFTAMLSIQSWREKNTHTHTNE